MVQKDELRNQLIEKARKQGNSLSYDDLLAVFPDAERDISLLDDVMEELLDAGIDVVSQSEPDPNSLYSMGRNGDVDMGLDMVEEDESDLVFYRDDDLIEDLGYQQALDSDDVVGLYLKEAGRVPLLTADEEVSLAKRMEIGKHASDILAERRAIFYTDALDSMGEDPQYVCRLAGVLRVKVERVLTSGRFAFVTFSDPTGEYEVAVLPETLEQARALLENGAMLTFKARFRRREEGDIRITAEGFEILDPNKGPSARGVKVILSEGAQMAAIAKAVQGACAVSTAPKGVLRLLLTLPDGREVEIEASDAVPVEPAARSMLKSIRGVEEVAWL